MKKILLIGISALLLLSGCNEEKFIPKTKEYYLNNIELAKNRLVECKKLGALKGDLKIDCINAQLAVNETISKSNRPIIGNETKKSKW